MKTYRSFVGGSWVLKGVSCPSGGESSVRKPDLDVGAAEVDHRVWRDSDATRTRPPRSRGGRLIRCAEGYFGMPRTSRRTCGRGTYRVRLMDLRQFPADEARRESPFSGFVSRLCDRRTWGPRRVLTGKPRTRISSRAMKRIPSGHAYYAPLPPPTDRPRRSLRR